MSMYECLVYFFGYSNSFLNQVAELHTRTYTGSLIFVCMCACEFVYVIISRTKTDDTNVVCGEKKEHMKKNRN